VWQGEGWKRTQRQLGVAGLIVLSVAQLGFHAEVPIGLYSIIGGLLGLDVLAEALNRVGGRK
jgi:hypothetical protein